MTNRADETLHQDKTEQTTSRYKFPDDEYVTRYLGSRSPSTHDTGQKHMQSVTLQTPRPMTGYMKKKELWYYKCNIIGILSGTTTRKKMQELVFPKGLSYDREIDDYRIIEVNNVFVLVPLTGTRR